MEKCNYILDIPELKAKEYDAMFCINNEKNYFHVDFESFKNGRPLTDNEIVCYTDGARNSSNTGYGLVIFNNGSQVYIENGRLLDATNSAQVSIIQAETFAIYRVAKVLLDMKVDIATIFSDCQPALSSLESEFVKSATAALCIDSLNELSTNAKIELKWIKAHTGFIGNEIADDLAKRSLIMENYNFQVLLPSPLCANDCLKIKRSRG